VKTAAPKPRATDRRVQARRAALNTLARARRAADRAGVELSDWEGEFLGSVEDRLKTHGRAFGDPEKGALGAALSILQAVKLKEIAVKASGRKPKARPDRGRRRRAGPAPGECR
jgi:hypothetical protein